MFIKTTFGLIVLITTFINGINCLTCYESDSEKGTYQEVSNPEWSYCVFVPSDNNHSVAKVFGVGPEEDSILPYDISFQQTNEGYKVLSVCLYEKYQMRVRSRLTKEYMFRCVCNYDLCNEAATFSQYLKKQRDSEAK